MKGTTTTKFRNKILLSLFLIVTFIFSPFSSILKRVVVLADTPDGDYSDLEGGTLSIENFESTVKYGEHYTLPKVNSSTYGDIDSDQIIYRVFAPSNSKVHLGHTEDWEKADGKIYRVSDGEGVEYRFDAVERGTYTLNIETVSSSGKITTVARNLKIKVEATTASIVLPANSQMVIPTQISLSKLRDLKIPVPAIFEGEEEKNPETNLIVKVIAGNGTEYATSYNAEGKYYTCASLETTEVTGQYEIMYIYKSNSGAVITKTTQPMLVVANDGFINKLKLAFTYLSAKPTTAVVGRKINLPTVKVYDENSGTTDAINAYIDITVKHVTKDEQGNLVEKPVDVENYSFLPEYKGDYVVTYQAKIGILGEEVKSTTSVFTIKNVLDTEYPSPIVVNEYELTDAVKKVKKGTEWQTLEEDATEKQIVEAMEDMSDAIPSVVVIPEGGTKTLDIPAIYATDNFTRYGEFTFVRSMKAPGDAYIELKDSEGVEYEASKIAEYTFAREGKFILSYQVKDGANLNRSIEYVIQVVSQESLNTNYAVEDEEGNKVLTPPSIRMETLSAFVNNTDILTFGAPVVKDELGLDSSLTVEVKAIAYDSLGEEVVSHIFTKDDITSSGKYRLDLGSFLHGKENVKNIEIHVSAETDYGTSNTYKSRTVEVIDNTDSNPSTIQFATYEDYRVALFDMNDELIKENLQLRFPDNSGILDALTSTNLKTDGYLTLNNGADGISPFNQRQTIELPTMLIKDKEDKFVEVSAFVTDKFGSTKSLNCWLDDVTKESDEEFNFRLTTSSFKATYSGVYKITYQIKDKGNHIVVYSYALRINDTEAPEVVVSGETSFVEVHELGTRFNFPIANVIDEGENIDSVETAQIIETPNGAEYTITTRGFTPYTAGVYTIRYTGQDSSGNIAYATYKLTVQDTIDPIIYLNENSGYFSNKTFATTYEWSTTTTNKIVIPYATVEDINLEEGAADIKVVNSNNITQTLTTREDGHKEFTANSQGVYTLTYTATDKAGRTATKTFKLKVGDCTAPTIEWENEDDIPTSLELNSKWVFDEEHMLITDLEGSETSFTVTLTTPSGEAVSYEKNRQFEFNEVGKYTLKIVVKDSANNTTPKNYTITVAEKDQSKSTEVSNTAGIILIVLSVMVLGGVIIYFIMSNKKPVVNAKNKSSKEDKE